MSNPPTEPVETTVTSAPGGRAPGTPVSTTTIVEVQTELERHPIRGFFWGLLAGLGAALVLIVTTVIEFALLPIVLVVVFATFLAVLWGIVGPSKPPKGRPPVVVVPTAAPVSSRFDDFTDIRATPPIAPTPPTRPVAAEPDPMFAPPAADEPDNADSSDGSDD